MRETRDCPARGVDDRVIFFKDVSLARTPDLRVTRTPLTVYLVLAGAIGARHRSPRASGTVPWTSVRATNRATTEIDLA